MRLTVKVLPEGRKPILLHYEASERTEAMAEWDRQLENARPGTICELINEDTGRITSSYHPKG